MRVVQVREGLGGRQGGLEDLFQGLEHCNASALHILARPDGSLASARFDVPRDSGSGYWEFLRLGPDIFAIVCNVQYPERVAVAAAGEDLIEFHFRLAGDLKLFEGDERFDATQGSLLIWRQPRGHDVVEHLSDGGKRETSVTFYCRPSFLDRQFGDLGATIDGGLIAALGPTCDRIQALNAILYPALTRLIVEFASPTDRSGLHLVKAEGLAIQIISEVLLNVPLQNRPDMQQGRLTDRDVDCLRAARRVLLGNHTPPPTIDDIGRRVGLSATKLKSGFRQLYGQTIAEFANDLRMTSAKELLRKSDKPIAQVSTELGYEYQNSFTVAFRRKWGILPKDYRRSPLVYDQPPAMVA